MDVATRFTPRARAQSYLDRNVQAADDGAASGTDSESLPRRKIPRTGNDSDAQPHPPPVPAFRKPALPASATRPGASENRASIASRRRSTLRENQRVPSGPREYPGSPSKRLGSISLGSDNAVTEITNTAFTPGRNEAGPGFSSTAVYSNSGGGGSSNNSGGHNTKQSLQERLSYGPARHSSADDTDSPTTPADFVPTMNFDDFQNSIIDPNWTSPILSQFPTVSGGRALPKEDDANVSRGGGGFGSSTLNRTGMTKPQEDGGEEKGGVARQSSLRRRLSAAPGSRQASGQSTAGVTTGVGVAPPNLSVRTRRQSHMPNNSNNSAGTAMMAAAGMASRPPRKSIGPGLITSVGSERKGSVNQPPTPVEGGVLKSAVSRTSSTSKSRRTTIQPSVSAGPELPRLSTLTATTQSRANKVKSLQPPPRGDPDTPGSAGKNSSKANPNRAHTPSSSGNRRQSTVSGRASGLGARTISPTDARRLKRMSMMHAPPMPNAALAKGPPTPQDEMPTNPFTTSRPELPHLAQPSTSFIPLRKMSAASTPTSARASPDGRNYPGGLATSSGGGSGVALSAKSSYQSLVSTAPANTGSRLPTPKQRQQGPPSRSEQYDDGEFVPPVPAIPKAFESPKEHELPPTGFFSSSLKSNHSAFTEPALEDVGRLDLHGSSMLPSPAAVGSTPRGSVDVPRPSGETGRKKSGEYARPQHKRTNTFGNGSGGGATTTTAAVGATKQGIRAPPDPNGRKNNSLQPLRLPPLNLMPLNTPTANKISRDFPRPSGELEARGDEYTAVQTPEPKRVAKTPSTPMTASKATFFRRRTDEDQQNPHQGQQGWKALRSSSSYYALRELQMENEGGANLTRFFDDSDPESSGIPIPNSKPRSAITPFASGSLPKSEGGIRGRASGEYVDDFDLGVGGFVAPGKWKGTPSSAESPGGSAEMVAAAVAAAAATKKEGGSGGGLRRKLSLGWRRSGSKAAHHKGSPQQTLAASEGPHEEAMAGEKKPARLQKRGAEMPPPRLPASATWSGGLGLTAADLVSRPSWEQSHTRRKSALLSGGGGGGGGGGEDLGDGLTAPSAPAPSSSTGTASVGGVKTRSLHSEQPQPVLPAATTSNSSSATRASSWGNFSSSSRNTGKQPLSSSGRPHRFTASTISAIVKDKDDLAADEEMRRLSTKRKDVDAAARETEALKARARPRSPMSPERLLHGAGGGAPLNLFERGEVMDYVAEGVYFTGTRNAKKIIGALTPSPAGSDVNLSGAKKDVVGNYGYDDERGDYNIVLGDHLAYRYEVVDVLGKGSFGQVVRCIDHKEGGVVAVKIIRNKKRFHQQALVEVGILGRLGEWDPDGAYATLSITSSFYFRSHLCIVTPCLSINLYELIRAHNFTGFALPLIRRFTRQLLACLVLLQQKRIIHCDLKPENILLCDARRADVRVIDFGSSCREEEKVYTYIQSRFYRSPEVILGSSYGLGIDMWSLGCILAELWTGYPLFPGENEQEQLACIMEIFGPPDRHLVERCTRKKLFFDSVGKPRVTVSSKGRRRRPSSRTLQQALKADDEAFVDFVARCLRWDPERRMKPHEAVRHPFVTNVAFGSGGGGIPEEARRPKGSAVGRSSPVKKAGNGASQSAPQPQSVATPAASRPRLPDTPQTVVRQPNSTANAVAGGQSSPSKGGTATSSNHHRRLSAAVAGSKRASNGTVLAGSAAAAATAATEQRGRGANGGRGDLAQMAARESMGGSGTGTGSGGGGRWRG